MSPEPARGSGTATRRRHHDREILRLALPAFGALAAEPVYVLTDTAIVGHLGTTELGGLAVASSILLTGYALFIFLAYATTASVSRLLGAGDERGAADEAVQGLWLATGIGVVLLLAGLVTAEPLIDLFGAEGAVADQALIYLRISLFGVPALLVVLAGTGYLRGLQDTRTPLVVAVATAVTNGLLEAWWIFGLGFGIGASALSTVCVQMAAAGVYLTRTLRSARRLGVPLRADSVSIRRTMRVGWALLVRTAALRAALVVTTAVAARLGRVPLAAHQIAFEIWSFFALCLDAVAIAGQAITGRLLGAGDLASARSAGRRMIEIGALAGLVAGLVVLALRTVLPTIFTDDAAVEDLCAFLLVWVAVLQPVNGVVFVLDGILIGAGDARFLAWAMAGAAAGFLPPAVAVAATSAGIGWLWAAIAWLMVLRLGALGGRFSQGGWLVPGARRATPPRPSRRPDPSTPS